MSNCQQELRAQGKAYPRTCQECGLGPCKRETPSADNSRADALTDERIFWIRDSVYDELKKKGLVLSYEMDLAFARAIAREALECEYVEQHEAAPADLLAHVKWLHYCLREAGHCIDGGKCHHECSHLRMGSKGACFRQDACVPLTGSRLTDDWKLPAPSAPLEGTGNGADERAEYRHAGWWDITGGFAVIQKDDPNPGQCVPLYTKLARAPRTEVAGAVPADDKPCTCHPDDRVEPCAKQYAASECKRAQHEPQVADDNTTWPVTSKNIALHALQARMAASQSTSDSHEWDDVGERCIKCGDKDWMADPVCRGATPAAAAGQEAVAWVRKHPDTGKLSGDWLWNDVIEQCRKDSGVWFPLGYLTAPPAQVATRQGLTEIEYEKVRLGLLAAKHFIANGISLGFIRMPDANCPDPAHNTPKLVDEALALLGGAKHE